MRQTVGEPAYFHGGRAEELFRQHLDQALAEKMTEAGAAEISGPMFELFQLNRR
jgi:flagellar protein FlgJ